MPDPDRRLTFFVVILTETGIEIATEAAERVRAVIRDMVPQAPDAPIDLTATAVVRPILPQDADGDVAVLDVFMAMARGKLSGGDCVVITAPSRGQLEVIRG